MRRRIHAAFQVTAALAAVPALPVGCGGRTGLIEDQQEAPPTPSGRDGGLADADAPPDAPPDTPGDVEPRRDVGPPGCEPSAETCNGRDDDCDGEVDEDLAPVPCPEGGFRYCVAGRLSECPRRCEACIPGSERICFLSYCKYWGIQTCTADGRSFGKCREADPPRACAAVARERQYSRALQQCCLENGYCCRDDFDVDGDGVTGEMLGNCDEVECR